MKKCPVCGVMMGDNVARCFMCKYDFQKAAREGEEAARKEASINVFQVEREASGRAAEKKAEGDKIIADAKVKSRLEIEAMERQLEGEKLRLEQEYVEIRRKSLEERSKLDAELSAIREQNEEEANLLKEARIQREKLIEGSKAAAQGEAARIIDEIHEETSRLAVQVQKELADAMQQKQQILDEAAHLAEETAAVRKKNEQDQLEYNKRFLSLEDIKTSAEKEAEAIRRKAENDAAEIRKKAESDSAARLGEIEQECKDAIDEAQHVQIEVEETKKMAAAELAAYVEEAKAAIAAAEEAQAARQKADDEVRAIFEKAEAVKAEAEEAKRKADEAAQAIYGTALETKRLAEQEEQAILQRAQEVRVKAKQEEQIYLDELEATQKTVQIEIDKIQEERRVLWETAELEAAAITKELQEASEMAKAAQDARLAAEEIANEAKQKATEESERIILEAEKRAIMLKEMGISQSEKGRIALQYEEISKSDQAKIAALQQELSSREDKLESNEQKVRDMMEEIERLQNSQLRAGLVPVSFPMEYEVEVIPHNSSGEVNSEAIALELSHRGTQGWKLHSLVNDEGGRVQASLGGSEKISLSGGSSTKQDRVILIFERTAPVNEVANGQNSSSL